MIAPHPRARACTCETVAILAEAAVKAGAPDGLIQCAANSTMEGTNELMRHRRTAVILSTGGAGIVRAAYSSGKPAYGVGPGNVPVLVDISANIPEAIAKIVEGKSFDYGTLCSSEQTLVAETSLREPILAALKANRAHRCDIPQTAALARLLITKNFGINPDCVGQAPGKIAAMAGFEVPKDTSILTVEIEGIGKEHPLIGRKAFAGFITLLRRRFRRGARRLRSGAAIRRARPHLRNLCDGRCAHPELRTAHASLSRDREFADANGFYGNLDRTCFRR